MPNLHDLYQGNEHCGSLEALRPLVQLVEVDGSVLLGHFRDDPLVIVSVRVYPKGSENGIDGGRIVELSIRVRNSHVIAYYNRKWCLETQRPSLQLAIRKMVDALGKE